MPTLSARAAAAYCGVSDKTIRRWIDSGAIRARRSPDDSRQFLIESDDLDAAGKVRQPHPIADTASQEMSGQSAEAADTALAVTTGFDVHALLQVISTTEDRADHWANEALRLSGEAAAWRARYEVAAALLAERALQQRPWWRKLLG